MIARRIRSSGTSCHHEAVWQRDEYRPSSHTGEAGIHRAGSLAFAGVIGIWYGSFYLPASLSHRGGLASIEKIPLGQRQDRRRLARQMHAVGPKTARTALLTKSLPREPQILIAEARRAEEVLDAPVPALELLEDAEH